MQQWDVHILILVFAMLFQSVTRIFAQKFKPPLRWAPQTHQGRVEDLRHSWIGFDLISLNESNLGDQLGDYVHAAHDEMLRQGRQFHTGPLTIDQMPTHIASLYIPGHGIFTASDYTRLPYRKEYKLHSTAATNFSEQLPLEKSYRAGGCAEMRALEFYHTVALGKPIPKGSAIAIWGNRRWDKPFLPAQLTNPCFADSFGASCRTILHAAGVRCVRTDPNARKNNGESTTEPRRTS